jgi:hypothetical protein
MSSSFSYYLGFSFWGPILLLIATGAVVAALKRPATDACLRALGGQFVLVRLVSGKWIWGHLRLFANCLEVRFAEAHTGKPGAQAKASYLLYEADLAAIDRIVRPAPAEGPAFYAWQAEVARLVRAGRTRRLWRSVRNGLHLLRDALGQSVGVIVGVFKQRTMLGRVGQAGDKVNEMGITLLNVVPNSYEPVLETYLCSDVIVEAVRADLVTEHTGLLEDYTAKYLLLRAVALPEGLPDAARPATGWPLEVDVVFPRDKTIVRHLAVRQRGARDQVEGSASAGPTDS